MGNLLRSFLSILFFIQPPALDNQRINLLLYSIPPGVEIRDGGDIMFLQIFIHSDTFI